MYDGHFCFDVLTQPGGRCWVIRPNGGVHLAISWSASPCDETKFFALIKLTQ